MWQKKKLLLGLQLTALLCLCWSSFSFADDESEITLLHKHAPANVQALTNDPDAIAKLRSSLMNNPDLLQELNETVGLAANNTVVVQEQTSDVLIPVDTVTTIKPSPWEAQSAIEARQNEKAFHNLTRQAFPLSPDQIQTLNSMLDETQKAQAADPDGVPPEPTSTSLIVNLSPGATPPVIRLSRGFVSSLVFIDQSGAPWPIEAYDLGNPQSFNIQWDNKSNTLMVQALSPYTYGNLAVRLIGMNTPVMLTLVPGQKVVDYRVDLRVQGLGPNAQTTIEGTGLPEQADQELLNILDGISPKGAKRLTVTGNIADAWEVGNTLFVRTRFTLLSPAWVSKMSSADGMNAYKLQVTPLLLISRYGKVLQLKVEGI